jgi:hypothetical protein
MVLTQEEEQKRTEIRAQVHEGTQLVLDALEPYDRDVRGIIIDSLERELQIRALVQDAVHAPEWYRQSQDETPTRLELPEFGPASH